MTEVDRSISDVSDAADYDPLSDQITVEIDEQASNFTILEKLRSIHARTILWYLVFIGYTINYVYRIIVSIAIIQMVNQKTRPMSQIDGVFECYNETVLITKSLNDSEVFGIPSTVSYTSRFSLERAILDKLNVPYVKNGFDWTEHEQALMLGSIFWLQGLTALPGAIITKKYGTKLVFGLSTVIGCILCFLIPILSYFSVHAVLCVRALQGLISGVAQPSLLNLAASWVPPSERSKFMTAFLGSSVSLVITYPIFGYIMYWFCWEWIFHICGIIGIIWYYCWQYFIYNTPAEHPRISRYERGYIENSLADSVHKHSDNIKIIPWKSILLSKSLWLNNLAQFGGLWIFLTLSNQFPTYFKLIHGWSVYNIGILSALPHLLRTIVAFIYTSLADYLLNTKKLSGTNIRKLSVFLSLNVSAIFLIILAYTGCNDVLALSCIVIICVCQSAHSAGPIASMIDISPNYASISGGICSVVSLLPGFISPAIVAIVTFENQTVESWKYIYLISAMIPTGIGLMYVCFHDSTVQSWNNPGKSTVLTEREGEQYELQEVKNVSVQETIPLVDK